VISATSRSGSSSPTTLEGDRKRWRVVAHVVVEDPFALREVQRQQNRADVLRRPQKSVEKAQAMPRRVRRRDRKQRSVPWGMG
jgi:hypothetical protein